MIVEPDFLTHWKTKMLTDELGDKAAPLYVIALWAHCQQRKAGSFSNLAPNALKAICRYEGEASKLFRALERCGFIDVDGEAVVVHEWAEVNAKLVANWTNGQLGGRPKKPNGNPTPKRGNPSITDRVDRSGEDEIDSASAESNPCKSPSGVYDPSFENWWKVYPRRTQKANAYKAWKAAGKSLRAGYGLSTADAISRLLESVTAFAASPKGRGQYVPHPATWLNRACYDDDRAAWQNGGDAAPPGRKQRLLTESEMANWNPTTGGLEGGQ